ncbi:autotransporter domain-containing protein [Methylobacillus sp.]|uniref:autotransporter domain-containing protein n=1 Tax=Methylobacillus sp. TaxID=56818 RepID=UPI0012C99116|nr:autotransporter domain-containing protein [Methylobacillus sp.]MPS49370.1 autotransporter domain-containing protein [Methylobacillus sp.]
MNRSFQSIFNARSGAWQAVPETVRYPGRAASVVSPLALSLILAACPALADEIIDNNETITVREGQPSSPWQIPGWLRVGNTGTGTLNIEAGGAVSSGGGYIGFFSGSTGNVTVTGPGSAWTNTIALDVGRSGTGTLNIEAGGAVSSSDGYIGNSYSGSTGNVTVTGPGSTWTNTYSLYVGYYGTGTLNIEAGGAVSSGNGYIGYSSGSTGNVTVTGPGSTWTNTSSLQVGYAGTGTGTLNIEAGGRVSAAVTRLAYDASSSATLTLSGASGSRGILETGQLVRGNGSSASVTLDGGILRARGDQANYLSGFGSGAITLGSQGVFFDTAAHAVGLDISMLTGSGGLTKLGAGTLTLTGAGTYTGATVIDSGTLAVNGSLTGSSFQVKQGGTLGGTGTVGAVVVDSGGTLAPGNSIGTLTVDGDLTFSSGATYQVEVDAAGNHDQVIVKGTASLGGNVVALAENGHYAANTTYTILSSDHAVTGTFGGVSSLLAFLDGTLDYSDPNKVNLVMSRNDIAYTDVAYTGNQRGVAAALESASSGAASADMQGILTAVNNLSAQQARSAYDSMSGVGLVSLQRAGLGFSSNFSNQLMGRLQAVGMSATAQSLHGIQLAANDSLDALVPALSQPTLSDAPSANQFSLAGGIPVGDGRHGFWLRGFGTDQDMSADRNATGDRIKGVGINAGVDRRVTDNLVLGAAFSHSRADIDAGTGMNGKSRGNAAAVYASYANGPWTFNGNLMFAHNANDMDRRITVGPLQRKATADFDSRTVAAYGEVSYDLPLAKWTLQPVAGLALAYNRNDGFTEKGAGALNIDADTRSITSTRTLLGTRALIELNGISIQPRAIWAHEFGDINKGLTGQLQGAPAASFKTYGVDLPRDTLITGMTIAGKTQGGLSLFTDVQGEFNSKQTNLALLIGVRKSW